MTIEAPLLEVKGLHAGYGNINILVGVNFYVAAGEPVTLVGTNGSGKSTIIRVVSGLLTPVSGTMLFKGRDISRMPAEKRVALGITVVPESRDLFAGQSVLANLRLGAYLRLRGMGQKDFKKDVDHVLAFFPALRGRLKQAAGTLSGGEQQMLAIGRALMSRPELLLLDEPSTGLAPLMVREIFRVLDELIRERALTVFLVEQNTRLALKAVVRGYVLERGRIVREGEARKLLGFLVEAGLTYGKAV